MSSVRITDKPVDLNLGGGTSVRNDGAVTVYYRDEQPVSATVNDGSLTAGSASSLVGTQWFATATGQTSWLFVPPVTSSAAAGSGVPVGGTTGQILRKNSNTDGDAGWATSSAAGPTVTGTTGNLGATATVDFASASSEIWLSGTLNANLVVTVNNPVGGSRLQVLALQDATGGRTLTVNGQPVTVPTTASTGLAFVFAEWVDTTNFRVMSAGAGGFANPMTTAGDLITGGTAGAPGRLGVGTNGQVLTLVTGAPAWANASSGGGAGATIPFVTGFYYMPAIVVGGSNITNSNAVAKAVSFVPSRTCTVDLCKIQVNVVATAGGVYRVAIYDDNAGIPGTLIDESSGTDVTTSTGAVTITGLSAAVTSGSRYWLVGVPQGAPATPAQFKGEASGGGGNPGIPVDPTNLSLQDVFQWSTAVSGAFPGTGGTSSAWTAGSNRPAIAIGAST